MSRGREGDGERETQGKREGERRKGARREEAREKEQGKRERERGAETRICIPGPPPATWSALRWRGGAPQQAGCPAAARGREADLGRGVRARSLPRPELEEGPQPAGLGGAGAPSSPPPLPRAAGRAVGLSRQRRESEAEQTLGELFPLAWKFIGNTCSGEAGHGEGEGREFSAPARWRLRPGSRRAPGRSGETEAPRRRAPLADAARGNSAGTGPGTAGSARGRVGEGWRGLETGLEPWRGGGASLTLMIFLWNVHPRVLIDHGPKIVLKGEEATKRKKWQNTPKRVWINPSSEVGFRAKFKEAVDLQYFFFPSDDYLIPIIASNTKNCSFPLLPPFVKL